MAEATFPFVVSDPAETEFSSLVIFRLRQTFWNLWRRIIPTQTSAGGIHKLSGLLLDFVHQFSLQRTPFDATFRFGTYMICVGI